MKMLGLCCAVFAALPALASWEIQFDETFEEQVSSVLSNDRYGELAIRVAFQYMPHKDRQAVVILDRRAKDGRRVTTEVFDEVVTDLTYEYENGVLNLILTYDLETDSPADQREIAYRCFAQTAGLSFVRLSACP
ncbi:MAG: hypothetical protein AB7G93_12130 [Bdellovibrionales bacterium]